MRLRPADPADAAALGSILGDWVRETGWMPVLHTREEDAGFVGLLIGAVEVTVACDGAPIGFLARDAEVVTALYVAAPARGRGVGAALLDGAKSAAARLELWAFAANVRALSFYRREGFRIVGRTGGANLEGLADLRLVWEHRP